MLQLTDVRIETMRRLYDKQKKRAWDGEYLDVLETALNLALGHKRAAEDPDLLCRSVIRDARRTIRRSQAANRENASRRPLPDPDRRRVCAVNADGTPAAEMFTHDTPESHAIAAETLQELRTFASTLGMHGPACLQDMLDSRTVVHSAHQAGVSVATIERTRRALREHTKTLIAVPA